jgi:hypothetical protein
VFATERIRGKNSFAFRDHHHYPSTTANASAHAVFYDALDPSKSAIEIRLSAHVVGISGTERLSLNEITRTNESKSFAKGKLKCVITHEPAKHSA